MNGSTPARARHRTPSLWLAAAAGERVLIPLGVFWKADSDYRTRGARAGGTSCSPLIMEFNVNSITRLPALSLGRRLGRKERHANEEHLGGGGKPPSYLLRIFPISNSSMRAIESLKVRNGMGLEIEMS